MSLLPNSATFHELVQDCFVAYRGRGVSLSSADLDLLDAWANVGVPVEVVIRGIRKAAEAALGNKTRLRSLSACQRKVTNEIKKYLRLSMGSAGETEPRRLSDVQPFHLVRHKKLLVTLRHVKKNHTGRAHLITQLQKALTQPEDFTAANRQEELVLAVLLRTLPYTERLSLLRKATQFMKRTKARSRSARHESLRFHRGALVRHRLEMPAFW